MAGKAFSPSIFLVGAEGSIVKTKKGRLLRKTHWAIFFCAVLALTFLVYTPGLRGGYLFDDEPNLFSMGAHGGVASWEAFRAFVFQGHSGPLGRPLALASFLLDANTWPSEPLPFKLTNLWIHLLTGVVLCWATLNLLRLYGVSERHACWGAVLNMAFWLLHPFMVSTTLYVVQRMAQLAALFMFAGLAGYLHGRLLLQRNRCGAAYGWMSASLILGTALAVLSKENGALLPLLAWVAEACRPRVAGGDDDASSQPDWRWRALFFWAPTAAIVGFLTLRINLSPDAWPTRSFNQIERVLTEPRILWEYLYQLYIPRIEGRGLFQDGYPFSTGLLQPTSTLLSLLGLMALLGVAIWIRRKSQWGAYGALALLFFLVAHLLESTVVGLELYFEHRNYVAAAFLFLPPAMGLLWLAEKRGAMLAAGAALLILVILSLLTWQRAKLWSNTEILQNYWAVSTPESPRAQNRLSVHLFAVGQTDEAFALLESAMQRLPHSSLVSMQWLLHKVMRQQATAADFERVRKLLPQQRFDAQTLMGMRTIVEVLLESPDHAASRRHALGLLDEMQSIPRYRAAPLFNKVAPYLRGLLFMAADEPDAAMPNLKLAMQRFNDIDLSLSTVANMANSGYVSHALVLLDEAQQVLRQQPAGTLVRTRDAYDLEILRIRGVLQHALETPKGTPHGGH